MLCEHVAPYIVSALHVLQLCFFLCALVREETSSTHAATLCVNLLTVPRPLPSALRITASLCNDPHLQADQIKNHMHPQVFKKST